MLNPVFHSGEIKKRSLQGAAYTIAAQFAQTAVHMVGIMILARLLSPEDYGLIAMVFTVTHFASVFKDAGLSMATIRQGSIAEDQLSCLHRIDLGVGIALTGMIALLAPAAGRFYGNPDVVPLMAVSALAFAISSSGHQHAALLQRNARFGAYSGIKLVGMTLGLTAAIAVALAGGGAWALVVLCLTDGVVRTVLFRRFSGWKAVGWHRQARLRDMLHFGAFFTASNIATYAYRHVDKALIGRLIGTQTLGFYAKAYSLMMLPIEMIQSPINRVAIPFLSKLQGQPDAFRRYFLHLLSATAILCIPLGAFLVVSADSVVLFILGRQWLPVGSLLRILALAACIQPVAEISNRVALIALGQGKIFAQWAAIHAVCHVFAFFVGIRYGAKGVALSYVLANGLLFVPSFVFALKATPVSIAQAAGAIWRPALSAVAASGLTMALPSFPEAAPFWVLVYQGIVFFAFYGTVFMILPGGKQRLLAIIGHVANTLFPSSARPTP